MGDRRHICIRDLWTLLGSLAFQSSYAFRKFFDVPVMLLLIGW